MARTDRRAPLAVGLTVLVAVLLLSQMPGDGTTRAGGDSLEPPGLEHAPVVPLPVLPAPAPTQPPTIPSSTVPETTTTTTVAPTTTIGNDPDLVWGRDDTPPSAGWVRPAFNQTYPDPVYGSPIRRLTSAEGTRFDRNTYSRRQAENADGTRFLTYHGDAEYRVYRRDDGSLVRRLSIGPGAEPQWHPTDPNVIRHIAGDNSYVGDLRYYETDVVTGRRTEIADLTGPVTARFPSARYLQDRDEGSPSADGDRLAWMIYDGAEDPIGIVHYELSTDRLLGATEIQTAAGPLDWVSSSPSGEYVVAGHWNGTFVYDADLTNRRTLNLKADHSDLAIDVDGRDVYVYQDFSSGPDAGWLTAVDLGSLDRTRLFDLYGTSGNTSIHVSGKGYDKPGWVVVSTYNCKVPGAWSCNKVMAVEIGGANRLLNLAHTYNCGEDYWTETHAVVNRSFTRVYFNSDAGSCGIDAEVYEITVPPFG